MIKDAINSVIWTLDGGIFGLLVIVIYSIIRTKFNEMNKK
ncbi:hypothetical protein B0P06_005552 [Clostridium saccharoperbutylacetonicum]|jgi:hypothetical protein|nr:hypothetical protein [Clostridium saccharoperbutylacetonicum]NSB26428.1 hypothetical protein [Clostridium saccharoperbutylacetonicum]NSB30766.1 hypothetical protein [Clostridium saccharoperbutylacetonicum]NSB45781.1 hypothetical protein [Clostridium saccharoperbutylacetonicum]